MLYVKSVNWKPVFGMCVVCIWMVTHALQIELIGADYDGYLEIMPELAITTALQLDISSDNEIFEGDGLPFSLATSLIVDYPFVALAVIAVIAFACVVCLLLENCCMTYTQGQILPTISICISDLSSSCWLRCGTEFRPCSF